MTLETAVKNSLDQEVVPQELKNTPFVIKLGMIIERVKSNHIKLN